MAKTALLANSQWEVLEGLVFPCPQELCKPIGLGLNDAGDQAASWGLPSGAQ